MKARDEDGAPGNKGTIVTFYSPTAASSCTTSLANVAWVLSCAGKRILIVDWNLDDPGLHGFFLPFAPSEEVLADSPGIVDMFVEFRAAVEESRGVDLAELTRRHADIEARVMNLGWSGVPDIPRGRIDYLGPGRRDSGYSSRLAGLSRSRYDSDKVGRDFVAALRTSMLSLDYDYVLVDSRTGPSMATEACTTQLPDVTVLCFTMNQRIVDHAVNAARAIEYEVGAPVRILPVPTRVEEEPTPALEEIRDYAYQAFDWLLPDDLDPTGRERYWAEVEIPYRSGFAYEPVLAALRERQQGVNTLLAAYVRLTDRVTEGAVKELHPLPPEQLDQLRLRLGHDFGPRRRSVSIVSDPRDRAWADWIRAQLEWTGVRVVAEQIGQAKGDDGRGAAADTTVVVLSPNLPGTPTAAAVNEIYLTGLQEGGTNPAVVGIKVAEGSLPPPFSQMDDLSLAYLDEAEARRQLLLQFRSLRTRAVEGDGPARGPRFPSRRPEVWNVTQRNEYFTGRDVLLEQMRDALGVTMADKQPVVLVGPPGSGKSELAKEYAWRFQADYDVVWWLRARSHLAVSGLRLLAERLKVASQRPGAGAVAPLMDTLRRGDRYKRWLLIYDGASSPGDLDGLLPPPGTGHVIVTTYHQDWAERLPTLPVGSFTADESVLLLTKRARNLRSRAAQEIADELGHLPHALSVAGESLAMRSNRGTDADPADEYLRQLRRQAGAGEALEDASGVALATALSLDDLSPQYPSSVRLLNLCAFASSDGIAMDILRSDAMRHELARHDADFAQERTQFSQVIYQVTRFSLARLDTGNDRLEVHPLIQRLLRARMTEAEREECQAALQRILAAYSPSDVEMDALKHDERYVELGQHVRPSGALRSDDDEVRRWLVNQVRFWYRRRYPEVATQFGRPLLERWTERFGEDDPFRLRLATQLANACRALGQYREAFDLVEPTLERQQRLLGPNHVFTLMTQRSHGGDLQALGRFADAYALDQATYQGFRDIVGRDHHDTLLAGHNLARSLLMFGSWEEAFTVIQEVFGAREKRSEKDILTWSSGNVVALCYRLRGEHLQAFSLASRCHLRMQDITGADSAWTFSAATYLAASHRLMGHREQALVEARRAYDGLQGIYGDLHPQMVVAGAELAACLAAANDASAALEQARTTHQTCEQIFGAEHPFTFLTATNRAAYAARCSAVDEALSLGEVARQGLAEHEHVGPGHPFALAAAVNHANALVESDELTLAEELNEQAYQGFRGRLGRTHPWTELASTNLTDTRARMHGESDGLIGPEGRDHIDCEIPAI